MKRVCAWTLGPILVLLLVALNFGPTDSSIIPPNGAQINLRGVPVVNENDTRKENITMKLLEEAVEDYVDLSNAFYAPATNQAQREKRTLNVFRSLANRTRSGVKSLRKLFSGRRRNKSESDEDMKTGRGFRKFFSNLLNRILVFITNAWDRLTGLFRGRKPGGGGDGEEGEDGESGTKSDGNKLVNRIRTGAAALAKRFRGAGGSGGEGGAAGILSSLTSLLGPQSTVEPYEVDYSDSDDKDSDSKEASTDSPSSSSTTERVDKPGNYESSGGYDGGYSSNAIRDPHRESYDNSASSSVHAGAFIPFPMDSDPNFHLNGAPSNYYSASSSPWIVRSPVQASSSNRYYSYYT